ncbi:hypothetical protein RJ639_017364, partial [Escallonia herrerae]
QTAAIRRFPASTAGQNPEKSALASSHPPLALRLLRPTLSPHRQKPRKSTDSRPHRSQDDSGFIRRLWPASSPKPSHNQSLPTLADHLGDERLNELAERKNNENPDNSAFLNRNRSCTEFSRFENEKESSKENHKPFFGGSMRYTGKFKFPGRSSTSSTLSSSKSNSSALLDDHLLPGRFSVDENALRWKSFGRKTDSLSDTQDSESECSDACSGGTSFGSQKNIPASYMLPTVSSRKSGVEVSSKYLLDRPRRSTSDLNVQNPTSFESSPKRFTLKNAMRRANSLTTHGSVTSKWAMSPGLSGSPPMSVENKGVPVSFSSLKPPTSPSRAKGVGNLLTMGLDLFKGGKKSSSAALSPLGQGTGDSVHQLRLLHNWWVQWRYANARAVVLNGNISNQAESNLLYASDGLKKLQHSVLQKKLQLEKEKLQMKLDMIVLSQIKPLEAWGDMERQHLSAVSITKDCLHSVVCRVPLIEGAKVEPQAASVTLRHASDLAASLKSMLSNLSPMAEQTVLLLSELAEVAAQEKSLLEECLEHFKIISTLEIEERSLKCNIIQMKTWQQEQQQHQQGIPA